MEFEEERIWLVVGGRDSGGDWRGRWGGDEDEDEDDGGGL